MLLILRTVFGQHRTHIWHFKTIQLDVPNVRWASGRALAWASKAAVKVRLCLSHSNYIYKLYGPFLSELMLVSRLNIGIAVYLYLYVYSCYISMYAYVKPQHHGYHAVYSIIMRPSDSFITYSDAACRRWCRGCFCYKLSCWPWPAVLASVDDTYDN